MEPEKHADYVLPTQSPSEAENLSSHPETPIEAVPEPSLNAPPEPPVPAESPLASAEPAGTEPEPEPPLDSPLPNDSSATPPEPGTLEYFAEKSKSTRLPADEESTATQLLRDLLLGGRSDITRATHCVLLLPWTIPAQAAASAWPEMKPTFRSQLLAGLTKAPGDQASRVRLSLARSLLKVDAAASLKLIILTLKVLRDKETGILQGRGAQIFNSVLIGKGKAWLLQLPLDTLKPAELDLLITSALQGAFHGPQPPPTQIGILRWAAELGKLSKLPPAVEEMALRNINRWNSKWQSILRKEVTPLPESWSTVFKSTAAAQLHPREATGEISDDSSNSPDTSSSRSRPSKAPRHADRVARDHVSAANFPDAEDVEPTNHTADSEDFTRSHEEEFPERPPREDPSEPDESFAAADAEESRTGLPDKHQKPRPVYQSKTIPRQGRDLPEPSASTRPGTSRRDAPFNLQEALRQIEAYTQGLKSELLIAQRQLRQRDDDRQHRRAEKPAPIPGEPSLEELNRLNQQLEFRNAELSTRIQELTIDSEERAASRNLASDTPPAPDPATELRVLLGLKLREDFEDFQALEQEKKDLVVQQHYRCLLRHVFEVLLGEGVRFPTPPPEG